MSSSPLASFETGVKCVVHTWDVLDLAMEEDPTAIDTIADELTSVILELFQLNTDNKIYEDEIEAVVDDFLHYRFPQTEFEQDLLKMFARLISTLHTDCLAGNLEGLNKLIKYAQTKQPALLPETTEEEHQLSDVEINDVETKEVVNENQQSQTENNCSGSDGWTSVSRKGKKKNRKHRT